MTTIYNTPRTTTRTGLIGRPIPVIPTFEERADAAPDAAPELHRILVETVASVAEGTARAEQELRVAEVERARAARALEHGLYPMTLDEAERSRLRAAHAAADSIVAEKRQAVEHSRTLVNAVTTVADAIGDLDAEDPELVNRLTATLALWQLASSREDARPGSRVRRA